MTSKAVTALCAASFLTLCACSSGTHDNNGGGAGGSSGGGTGGSGGGSSTGGGSAVGGGSATGGGSAMGGGTGGGGETDAGPMNPCGAGAHLTDAGCASTFDGWSDGGNLMVGRDHHVTFTAVVGDGGVLFVAGGFSGASPQTVSALLQVEAAPIGADGTLGDFNYIANLPAALGGQGCAQVGPNTVVLAGGLDNTGHTVGDSTVVQIDDTGMPTFTSGPKMSAKRYHVSVSFHGGYVYAIGGLVQSGSSQSVSNAIERAAFDGTTLGAWETLTPLPMKLTHHAAVVDGDALYLLGGITNIAALTQVLRADFDGDGGLGAFTQVGTLPAPRATSAGFYKNGYLYLLAGSSSAGNDPTTTFERAPVDGDGGVGTWEPLMDLPIVRQHSHQVPWFNGFIYSVAGSDTNDAFETAAFVGKFE